MKLPKNIVERSNSPLFLQIKSPPLSYSLTCDLPHNQASLTIHFNLKTASELLIQDIHYQTNLSGDYLGLLDFFVELMQNRALESIDRINAKEFDYFLREDKARSAFEYYSPKMYEILGIGEKIYQYIRPNQKDNLTIHLDYFSLPFSDQIELFEECLAQRFYKSPLYSHFELNITEIENGIIYIQNHLDFDTKMKEFLNQEIKNNLLGEVSFKLVFR